jgi:hypothetical protein
MSASRWSLPRLLGARVVAEVAVVDVSYAAHERMELSM